MERSLTRHFTALNRLCEALDIPDDINQEISEGVIALIHNSAVQKIEADDFE
jgi:methylglyoxal synthase